MPSDKLPEFYTRAVFIDDAGDAIEARWDRDTGFKITFNVEKVSKRKPDSAEVTVYNLLPSNLKKICTDAVELELYAGYQDPAPMLFKGPVEDVVTGLSSDHVDTMLTVYAEDTKRSLRETFISRSFSAGVALKTVLQDLAAAAQSPIDATAVSGQLHSPLPLLGPPSRLLEEVCNIYGYRYQIVGGVLVVLGSDTPLSTPSVPVISKLTGMRGVPSSALEKKQIKITVETSLDPLLQAGGLCVIETESFVGSRKAPIPSSATYYIERAVHTYQGAQATSLITGREYGSD